MSEKVWILTSYRWPGVCAVLTDEKFQKVRPLPGYIAVKEATSVPVAEFMAGAKEGKGIARP